MNRSALDLLSDSLVKGECLLLVLSRKRRDANGEVTKVSVRPLIVRERPVYQFTFHQRERVTHENLPPPRAAERAARLLAESFDDAALYTLTADYALRRTSDGSFGCKQGPPTKSAAAPPAHNRTKAHLIPEESPAPFWLKSA